jgi:integrase
MLTNSRGQVGTVIELHNSAAKKGSGRMLPLNKELRLGLMRLREEALDLDGPVICSERGGACSPRSIVNWFRALYQVLDFEGCSSHSGRRTFITNAARLVAKVGGSLRDVQQLAGHRSIEQTQSYIEGNNEAKRRLVQLI